MLPSCATEVQHAGFIFHAVADFYEDFTPWSPASHGDFTPIGAMARTSISEVLLHDASHSKRNSLAALTLGAIGVVYGDIGTSPLYAFREALAQAAQDGISRGEIIGVLSLALWALIIVVTMKYVLFLTRMDNGGEGGVLSLMALARRATGGRWLVVAVLGATGAALFYGDAIITPAPIIMTIKHLRGVIRSAR